MEDGLSPAERCSQAFDEWVEANPKYKVHARLLWRAYQAGFDRGWTCGVVTERRYRRVPWWRRFWRLLKDEPGVLAWRA